MEVYETWITWTLTAQARVFPVDSTLHGDGDVFTTRAASMTSTKVCWLIVLRQVSEDGRKCDAGRKRFAVSRIGTAALTSKHGKD